MRLEVKESGQKEYYDEFLYIVSKYRDFKKNPRKRAYQFTKYLMFYNIVCFLAIVLFAFIYKTLNENLYIFLSGMLIVILLFGIIYQIKYSQRIKDFMNNKGLKIVEINEKGFEYIDDEKNLRIKWEDIKYIIINKYSMCVLPKTILNGFTSISVSHKNELLEALKKYSKENLLVDNSKLYK